MHTNDQLMTPKSTPVEDDPARVLDTTSQSDHMEILEVGFNHPDDRCVCNVTVAQPSSTY